MVVANLVLCWASCFVEPPAVGLSTISLRISLASFQFRSGGGIHAGFTAKVKPKRLQQFNASEDAPVAVMLRQDVLEAGQVRVK